jgi:hypothetical protein
MREPSAPVSFAAIAFLAGFAVAAFAPQIFHDGDTWWHLAAGDWMLTHRVVPTRDIFTFTFAGQPWNAQEWLSEILMALAFRVAGWSGLHILFGVAFGATAAIVMGCLRRRMDTVPALLTGVLGLICVAGSLLARPHILALPLLALWTASLVEARAAGRTPPWWLAGVMLLWANLHGSFAFGLALAAALGFEASLQSADRKKNILHWGTFLIASIVAAMLTPRGLDGLLFPFKLLMMPGIAGIGEWAPSDLTHPSPFLLALLAMIAVLIVGKPRLPAIRALLALGLVYLALAHMRHQMLFGVAAPLLAAPSLGAAWPTKSQTDNPWLVPGAVLALALLLIVRVALPATRMEDRVSPMAALAHVPPGLRSRPVLNAYDYGGYLIFQGVKVFIDGRTDMYSTGFLKNYDQLAKGGSALTSTLAHDHIAWTIFPTGSKTARALDHMPGWHRLYGDANATVHVRD